MKIGLLTYHRAYNCGAMLQAWALQRVLERLGHIVSLPSCNKVGETPRWQYTWTNPEKKGFDWIRSLVGRSVLNVLSIPTEDIRLHRYRRFRKNYMRECDCQPHDFDKCFDSVVVGSDQVWSDYHSEEDAPLFFGENIPPSVRKIAYAVSYGDKPLEGPRLDRLVAAAARFDAVSVRERMACNQLGAYLKAKIPVVLDPTLLLTAPDYDEVESKDYPLEPYLFMYTISKSPFMLKTARELARRMNVRCVIAPCYQYGWFGAEKDLTYSISPDRLVSFSKHAKYIVTGSFHGTVMGLLFNKPTISLRDHVDQYESRPASLLNMLGCGERIANPDTKFSHMEGLLKFGFTDSIYLKLNEFRAMSMNWLSRAISS